MYTREAGRSVTPRSRKQYRPMAMDMALCFPSVLVLGDLKSPRIVHSAWIMVYFVRHLIHCRRGTFPPRMMYCDPNIVALRETLLPVSCRRQQRNNIRWCTVTIYSLTFWAPVRLDMSRENIDHQKLKPQHPSRINCNDEILSDKFYFILIFCSREYVMCVSDGSLLPRQ